VIVALALGYLCLLGPWRQVDQSLVYDAYSSAGAVLSLALLPRGTKLWVAVAIALGIALLIMMAGRLS